MDHYSNCHHKAAERKTVGNEILTTWQKGSSKLLWDSCLYLCRPPHWRWAYHRKMTKNCLVVPLLCEKTQNFGTNACIFPRFAQLGYKLTIFLFTEFVIREFIRFGWSFEFESRDKKVGLIKKSTNLFIRGLTRVYRMWTSQSSKQCHNHKEISRGGQAWKGFFSSQKKLFG